MFLHTATEFTRQQVQRRLLCHAFLFGLSILLVGCSRNDMYPVHGKVSFPDNTPLSGGWVEMQSSDSPSSSPRGPINADGTFVIGTFKEGDGARPGKYRVLVSPPGAPNPDLPKSEQPAQVKIAAQYKDFKTSGIEFEVDPKRADNQLDITVKRAP